MEFEVLLALLLKHVEKKLDAIPAPQNGRRGLKGKPGRDGVDGINGRDGKDFVFDEHADKIKEFSKEFALKFSDLNQDEVERLRGPRGLDGRDGKSFVFDEHREFFESLKLTFSDLTESDKEELKLKFNNLTESEKDSLKLKFSDLNDEEKFSLRGKRGQRGRPGRDGESIIGPPGKTGPQGRPGLGVNGRDGLDGIDGKDAPRVIDVEVVQDRDDFYFIFHFSDGSEIRTDDIQIPKSKSFHGVFVHGGEGGGGGSGTPGADGKSAYEIAVDNGFIGTEAEWLESLVGLSAYEIAVEEGFAGTEAEWLESLKASIEFYDENDLLGSPTSVDFVGDGVTATFDSLTKRATVNIPGGGDSAYSQLFDCELSVFVGAAVRLKKENSVPSVMSEWPTLNTITSLAELESYDKVAANALADSLENSNVIGIVESKPTATTCNVRIWGPTSPIYTGLDVSEEYYLSDVSPGNFVPYISRPSDVGSVEVKLGQAMNENRLIYIRGERREIS